MNSVWGVKKGNERRPRDGGGFPRIMVSTTKQIHEDEERIQTQIVSEIPQKCEELIIKEPGGALL